MTHAGTKPSKIEILPPEGEGMDPFLEELSQWMDSKFEIPGLKWRFGLDAVLGLLPGLGDTVTFLVSCYILLAAARHGVPRITIARMGMNVAIDLAMGCIPILGDVFDIAWKANTRNVELLKRTLDTPLHARRRGQWADWLFVIGGMTILFLGMLTMVYLTWSALAWLFGRFEASLS